jgi:type II secretory pathway pseudopilin PulG
MRIEILKNLKIKIKNSDKAFTLIELLLFMGIFSILMITMLELLTSIFDVQLESQSTAAVSRDAGFILSRLTYDVNSSTGILTPVTGSQSATLILTKGTDIFTYSLIGSNLTLKDGDLGTTEQLNSIETSVTNLNFLRLSATGSAESTITVSFTLKSNTVRRGGVQIQNFKETVGTR